MNLVEKAVVLQVVWRKEIIKRIKIKFTDASVQLQTNNITTLLLFHHYLVHLLYFSFC